MFSVHTSYDISRILSGEKYPPNPLAPAAPGSSPIPRSVPAAPTPGPGAAAAAAADLFPIPNLEKEEISEVALNVFVSS